LDATLQETQKQMFGGEEGGNHSNKKMSEKMHRGRSRMKKKSEAAPYQLGAGGGRLRLVA